MAAGQDEPVAAGPVRIGGVVAHQTLVVQVGRRGQAHRGAGVAVADLLHGVGGQETDGVHGLVVEVSSSPVRGFRTSQRWTPDLFERGSPLTASSGRQLTSLLASL